MSTKVLPTYISLLEAAQQYTLPPPALQNYVDAGIVRAVQTPGSDLLVSAEDVQRLADLPLDPTLSPEIDTYISLPQALALYPALAPATLHQYVNAGIIKAIQTTEGELLVNRADARLALPVDPALKGKPISVTEAAEKYGVSQANLSRWSDAGYIRIISRSPGHLILDEGEVQRAATIFKRARHETGSFVRAGWVLKRVLSQMQPQSV